MEKRILAVLLSISMLVCGFSGFSVYAAATLTMDKTAYFAGEAHTIEYSGLTGSEPWWGIYWRYETPGAPGVGSRFWCRLSSESGTIDLNNIDSGSSSSWDKLSVGEYKLCLIPDENKVLDENNVSVYNVVAQFDFEIVKNTQKPQSPINVFYNRESSAKQGLANGTITITPPADTDNMSGYAAYWGDDDSIFEGYAPIKIDSIVDTGKTTKTYEMVDNTFIPAGATKLYVYSARGTAIENNPNDIVTSADAATADIPNGSALNEETPLYSFAVTSDWHVFGGGTQDNIKATRLDGMLKDVKETDPDCVAILAVGDVVDNSNDDKSSAGISVEKALSEYEVMNTVINANSEGLPSILFGVGNHDLRGYDGYEAQLERFLENTGTEGTDGKPYYYKEIGGAKFIMLGGERTCDYESHNAWLSQTQLTWLESTLAEHSKTSEPIFVFLHQGMNNTVAGTTRGFDWAGVEQDAKLRAILKKYPNAVYFSGHTHWELEAYDNMFTGYGEDFTAFNTAGVGKVYTDNSQDKEGSQGLYVEVYKDKILVRGRDFENKLWVTSAQFMSDTSLPADVKAQAMTKSKSAILENGEEIIKLYEELDAMDGDRGSFESVYAILADAKTVYESIDSEVKAFKAGLDMLSQQIKDNSIEPDLLISLKNQYDSFSGDQKEYLDGADEIIEDAVKQEQQNNGLKITGVVVSDKNNNSYNCTAAGNTFVLYVPEGTDLSDLKLSITSSDEKAVYQINGVDYVQGSTVDLSAKQITLNAISSLGYDIYNSEYVITVNIVSQPNNSGTAAPTVTTPQNGTQVVNGKTVLYVNGAAVTGTKVVTVSGKMYAVVGGYVKTGKKQVVKIKSLYYIVNKLGVVQKGTKNKLIKVGTKSYVVNKNGVVQRKASGKKLVKVGAKSYIVNKLGVVQKGSKNKLVKIGKKAYIVNKKGVVQKNKKSIKAGKKTYKTNKKGVATLKK